MLFDMLILLFYRGETHLQTTFCFAEISGQKTKTVPVTQSAQKARISVEKTRFKSLMIKYLAIAKGKSLFHY